MQILSGALDVDYLQDASILECICCRSAGYRPSRVSPDGGSAIAFEALVCESCGNSVDIVEGVPFFGGYQPQDFPSLIEATAVGNQAQNPIDIDLARRLNWLLSDYHQAVDKSHYIQNHSDDLVRAPWFSGHRYHEWILTSAILSGKELAGKAVLNVGADFGVDGIDLVDAGAQVTFLNSMPKVASLGKKTLPEARWIGGFVHSLPFRDDSFDIVLAKAVMRRLRPVPPALREMLRVLKPGGFLLIIDEPIRPDHSDENLEFEVFNSHEGVLSGFNEGIIRFGDFYDTLAEFGDQIELALIASVQDPSALQGTSPVGDGAFNDYWVPCWPDNIEYLRNANGAGLCVAVKKVSSITLPAERQSHYVLPAGVLASWIGNPETAFARLMAWAPDELVNLPFPGVKQDWFSLLNGWQRPEPSNDFRRGFQRARWLLRCPGSTKLAFSIRATLGVQDIEVYINGTQECSASIDAEWRRIELDISDKAGALPFLVELRLAGSLGGLSFEQRCFDVRDRLAI